MVDLINCSYCGDEIRNKRNIVKKFILCPDERQNLDLIYCSYDCFLGFDNLQESKKQLTKEQKKKRSMYEKELRLRKKLAIQQGKKFEDKRQFNGYKRFK